MKKLTISEFVERAKKIHGDKYDYSKSYYIHNNEKIKICCKKHGLFNQTPHIHLHGSGCPICKGGVRCSLEDFICKAKKLNKNKYDYSKTIYKNSITKIKIICKLHGSFFQIPGNHLNLKQGCPTCANNIKLNTNEFINKAHKIHGNKYDYSKSVYGKNNVEKVIIICKKHGPFLQRPTEHLSLRGCPKCNYRISKPETEFLNYLEIPNTKENRQVKIGKKKVDGFKDGVIYEFLGDYWHGNPQKYNFYDLHPVCKKTYGQLYEETKTKFKKLRFLGYNVKYIWESDWKKFKLGKTNNPIIKRF